MRPESARLTEKNEEILSRKSHILTCARCKDDRDTVGVTHK